MSGFQKKALWIALEGRFRERISRDPAAGAEQIRKIVSDCAEMGFNLIFPCVRTHDNTNGYTSDIEKNYYGWDLLEVFCEECKKHDIELHPWFCFWGDGARVHPEATVVDYDGSLTDIGDGNLTMCPMRPEAQEYMLSLVTELVERYPIDGFHLDYIRYPHRPCYCDYHRDQFRQKFGTDPHELDESSQLWDAWNQFNVDGLTDFVGRVSGKVSEAGKKVSAALFPCGRHAVDSPDKPLVLNRIVPGKEMGKVQHNKRYWAIFQDWPYWCRMKYLDYAAIMQYTPHLDMAAETAEAGPTTANGAQFIMGLGLIWDQTADTLVQQIQLCAEKGLTGICFYDYFHLMDWSESDRAKVIASLK